jgi:Mg/Co/Ni transporter MgtE
LNDFINTTAITDDKSQVTVNNNPKPEKIFADVSDKELNDFLDQMPTDDEIDIN